MGQESSNKALHYTHKGAIVLALFLGGAFLLSMGAHLHPALEALSNFPMIYLVAAVILSFVLAAFREWTLVALCAFIAVINIAAMQPETEPAKEDTEQVEQTEQ